VVHDADVARFEKRLGSVLCGKWALERLLGVGGMAAVYAARHRIGTEVAIKMLHPELARSSELRSRFEREAQVSGKLKHPGAVEVRDVDVTEDGVPFMVMELLDGVSLSTRLRDGPLELGEALRYIDELCEVLGAAHAEGIIHRDIKPDNVFVTTEGHIKVLDFGIARLREGRPMTLVGARLGTLPYMPPEQVAGRPIDARADIFALGALMFRLLSGRRIHEAKTESDLLVKMATTPPPPLESVAPHMPDDVCAVANRALAFEVGKRYPSSAVMQGDVRALRSGDPPPFAMQALSDHGPPNPMVEPSSMPSLAVGSSSPTMATKVATPAARHLAGPVVVTPPGAGGAAGPASATAAAMSATGAAPPPSAGPPGSAPFHPGNRTAVLASVEAMESSHTRVSAGQGPTRTVLHEPTRVSSGVAETLPHNTPRVAATLPPGSLDATGGSWGASAVTGVEQPKSRWILAALPLVLTAVAIAFGLWWMRWRQDSSVTSSPELATQPAEPTSAAPAREESLETAEPLDPRSTEPTSGGLEPPPVPRPSPVPVTQPKTTPWQGGQGAPPSPPSPPAPAPSPAPTSAPAAPSPPPRPAPPPTIPVVPEDKDKGGKGRGHGKGHDDD
jgi:serine/threonine-protein kinase